MSNYCKTKCIDQDKIFCTNTDMTNGVCYETKEDPKRLKYCSNDNPSAPKMFKLFTCPNEKACESKYMTPPYSGEPLTRMVDKWTYGFVKNDVCSYLVSSPGEMQKDDKIFVKIDKILNC